MIAYLFVRFFEHNADGVLITRMERLPFRKTHDGAVFPCGGPTVMPTNIHERGCPSWARLIPGYTAYYAGVRYRDLADFCKKWGIEPVVLETV